MTEFTEVRPTLDNYWRAIILFGRNVASYKFALGKSLLAFAILGFVLAWWVYKKCGRARKLLLLRRWGVGAVGLFVLCLSLQFSVGELFAPGPIWMEIIRAFWLV